MALDYFGLDYFRPLGRRFFAGCLVLASLVLVGLRPAWAGPKVITSIKPVQFIVAAITEGVTEPGLLMPSLHSPHHYALRVSDIRVLRQSQIVFWIGPSLESPLSKPLAQLRGVRIVALAAQQSDARQPVTDPHIWLSLSLAEQMAADITAVLSEEDPSNASRYRENLSRFRAGVRALDLEIDAMLEPVRERGFYVFHDAYRHFLARYPLSYLGAVTPDEEQRPGARKVMAVKEALRSGQAVCLFAEPGMPQSTLAMITDGIPTRIGYLDPLGRDVKVGELAYVDFMRGFAASILSCLES